MKKAISLLVLAMCFCIGYAIAQDSTQVSIAQSILPALSAKFTFLPYVLGALFAVSEGLSFIPSVKANGVFQLIFGWLKALTGQK